MPSLSDDRWLAWSRPLKVFIGYKTKGRSWLELDAWGEDNRLRRDVIRQLIAWLEHNNEIEFNHKSQHWRALRHGKAAQLH